MEDPIDYGAGIRLLKKTGDPVRPGEELARLYSSDAARLGPALDILSAGVEIGARRPRPCPVILKTWK